MPAQQKKWNLQPQECPGTYTFSGKIYMTRTVSDTLPPEEVNQIISDVRGRVKDNNGADYLQVFIDDTGQKIFVIDQLNKEMKDSNPPDWVRENDYFTILFAEEY